VDEAQIDADALEGGLVSDLESYLQPVKADVLQTDVGPPAHRAHAHRQRQIVQHEVDVEQRGEAEERKRAQVWERVRVQVLLEKQVERAAQVKS